MSKWTTNRDYEIWIKDTDLTIILNKRMIQLRFIIVSAHEILQIKFPNHKITRYFGETDYLVISTNTECEVKINMFL